MSTTLDVQLALRATPEQVWQALTDGDVTPAYYLDFQAHYGDLAPGSSYTYTAGGGDMITGEILESSPGERLKTIERRGFQPLRPRKKSTGPTLSAVNCPFCGQQVLVAPNADSVEAECRGCDTAFQADAADVYQVSLGEAKRPQPRQFLHEVY